MGWLIAVGALCALLLIPLGIGASYEESGAAVWLTVGLIKIPLYPRKDKKTKGKKVTEKSAKEKEKGGDYADFLPLIADLLELLSDLRRKLIIKKLRCKLTLAGGDPCDLAVNYGKAWAALGGLTPVLDKVFVIKKKDLSVDCDFTDEQTRILFYIDGRISLMRLLAIVVIHGASILKKYNSITNQRKGGAAL